MARIERFRLAVPDKRIPMPDRGGRLFAAGPKGEAVDREDRFYATLIADRDIVPVDAAPGASPAARAGAPEGRRTDGGPRSRPRPSAGASHGEADVPPNSHDEGNQP